MLCKKRVTRRQYVSWAFDGEVIQKNYIQYVTKVVVDAESPGFTCVSTIWFARHLKLVVRSRCCLITSSHDFCGMSTDEKPNSFNCSCNAQNRIEFSPKVVLVQGFAKVEVSKVCGSFWTWFFLGSHLWTIVLCLTWEVIEDESGVVDFGRHSCFGFDFCQFTHCVCLGWGLGTRFLEDFVWQLCCGLFCQLGFFFVLVVVVAFTEIWVPKPNTNQHDEPVIWVSKSDELWHALNLESYLVVEIVVASWQILEIG